MHLWWTHLLLPPLILMFNLLLDFWVWQAPKFAALMLYVCQLCHELSYVCVVGQTLFCYFGRVTLCVIWVMLPSICFNE